MSKKNKVFIKGVIIKGVYCIKKEKNKLMGGVKLCVFKKKKQLIFTLGKALSKFQ